MGLSGISITQLLLIAIIVILVFGTKRLRSIGSDLGAALKSFRNAFEGKDETEHQNHDNKPPVDRDKV